ncbi:MAG: VanZ family protein [Pseudomonadales bacterium]|nr:VanZ family protein [Gammaproteobacteria bacterium]NNC55673.1 VanZ family protein [Pseudomonadales bacterium]
MITLLTAIKTYWIAITLFTLTVITLLSLYPLESLPAVPGSDKTHHFIAYGALMFPTALRKPKYWPLIGLFFICWSGLLELLQPYVNRYGEWLDLAANTAGLICGLLLVQLLNWTLAVRSK